MMAIKIDNDRGLVWTTEILIPGFDGMPDSAAGRSAVCCFDLRTRVLKDRYEGPSGAQWGDMILDREGTPIVSDGQSGAIYRLAGDGWRRLDKGDFISPQTMAITNDGKSLIVPDYLRGLAVMDIHSGDVTWIRNIPAHPCALNGIDGVYCRGRQLLLTQNGVEPERVLQLSLDQTGHLSTSFMLIERATPELGEPTHGVIVDGIFYFIANSGWNALDEHGKLKPGARMTPPLLMRYRLTPIPPAAPIPSTR
jgi:hypothetical protein